MSVFLYIKIGRDVPALVGSFNGQIRLVAKIFVLNEKFKFAYIVIN